MCTVCVWGVIGDLVKNLDMNLKVTFARTQLPERLAVILTVVPIEYCKKAILERARVLRKRLREHRKSVLKRLRQGERKERKVC